MQPLPVTQFVDWEEKHVSEDRGSRVVHYYLKDRQGQETLAVVGTERSRRHMVYTVCDDFLSLAGIDKKTTAAFKWRARREVVDWLAALSSSSELKNSDSPNSSGLNPDASMDEQEEDGVDQTRSPQPSSVFWTGTSWTCRKRLNHYTAFKRNGITISVKDFVLVMAEAEKEHHVAYVEDMYEDKKCRKKLRVRWFHKRNELSCKIPPPAPHRREIFFTQFPQVISVECVDGLATVLAPEHFEKCPSVFSPDACALIHLCYRQLDSDGISTLNICEVDGYWQQKALSLLVSAPPARELSPNEEPGSDEIEDEETEAGNVIRRARRSTRCTRRRAAADRGHSDSAQDGSAGNSDVVVDEEFPVGDKVELMISELKGCWFKGTVVDRDCEVRNGTVIHLRKIRYDDFKDVDDGSNFEEWRVLYQRFAPLDALGVHAAGRPTIRPHSTATGPLVCQFGAAVEAWFDDGWFEGLVLRRDGSSVVVYLPGEGVVQEFQVSDLRPSRDWVDGRWVDVRSDPDALENCDELKEEIRRSVGDPQGGTGKGVGESHSLGVEPGLKRKAEERCSESMQQEAVNVEVDDVEARRLVKRRRPIFVQSLVMSR